MSMSFAFVPNSTVQVLMAAVGAQDAQPLQAPQAFDGDFPL
jgi:hypothetical protein